MNSNESNPEKNPSPRGGQEGSGRPRRRGNNNHRRSFSQGSQEGFLKPSGDVQANQLQTVRSGSSRNESGERKPRERTERKEGENLPHSGQNNRLQGNHNNRRRSGNNNSHDRSGRLGQRNRGDRNRRSPARKKLVIPPFERRTFDWELTCIGCGKLIKDMFSAFVSPENPSGVYHFDCAFTRIKEREELVEGESVIYVGSGNFAIARLSRNEKGKPRFEIVRKIEFEPEKDDENPIVWRKLLQQR